MKKENAYSKRKLEKLIYVLLLIMAIIAADIIIHLLPSSITRKDMTSIGLYTLSDQSLTLLDSLESNVELILICKSGAEDSTLTELLKQYEHASDKVSVQYVDPSLHPGYTAQFSSDDIDDNSIIVICGSNSSVVHYSSIYQYQYSNLDYMLTGASSNVDVFFDGEGQITSAIRSAYDPTLCYVYELTGHGEATLSSDLLSSVEREGIVLTSLNLAQSNGIPDNAECVFINAPVKDITEHERDILLDYLSSGGRLMLITDYLSDTLGNLLSIPAEYGMDYVPGIVIEAEQSMYVSGYPYYLLPEQVSHDITSPLISGRYQVLLPTAHGINKRDDLREDLYVNSLLRSSNYSYSKTYYAELQTFDYASGDISGPFMIGAIATDRSTERPAKLVWYSSSSLLDEMTDTITSGANTDLMLNSLDYLCDREDSISIHYKPIEKDTLTLTESQSRCWSIFLIAVLPFGTLIISFIVCFKRRHL